MKSLLERLLRAGGIIVMALARFRERTELVFLSEGEKARRTTGRLETLKRAEMEAERIDRLRNPGNYQGR